MAKTVDNFSTIENFRQTYNELATDVGTISGLQTPRQGNLVDALNSVNEKDFFFQEFIYVVSSQGTVTFTGNDNVGNLLKFRDDRIQVFVRGEHLIEGIDYVISNQKHAPSRVRGRACAVGAPHERARAPEAATSRSERSATRAEAGQRARKKKVCAVLTAHAR